MSKIIVDATPIFRLLKHFFDIIHNDDSIRIMELKNDDQCIQIRKGYNIAHYTEEIQHDEDRVSFFCPICFQRSINLAFRLFSVRNCRGAIVNPYILSICNRCLDIMKGPDEIRYLVSQIYDSSEIGNSYLSIAQGMFEIDDVESIEDLRQEIIKRFLKITGES